MTSVTAFFDQHLTNDLQNLPIQDQVILTNDLQNLPIQDQDKNKMKCVQEEEREKCGELGDVHDGVCAICLDDIELKETALIKGCEHAYCVQCILQWATYHELPKCPQCKHPFESLSIHRALDGSLHDYLFEESVCLLLRAAWFKPLVVEHQEETFDERDDIFYYQYQYQYEYEEEDELDDVYFHNLPSLRIGNRRWGDNGYVRAGRQEARPVSRLSPNESGASAGSSSSRQRKKKIVEGDSDASSSHEPKKKEGGKDLIGRRAKRALKREAADKAAAVKHQQHLVRLGRE